MDYPTDDQLAWVAALWAGEGSVWNNNGKRNFAMSIGMLDHVSIERCAYVFNKVLDCYPAGPGPYAGQPLKVSYQAHCKGGVFARMNFGGYKAYICLRAIWPWLHNTDKGRQAERALLTVGLPVPRCEKPPFAELECF